MLKNILEKRNLWLYKSLNLKYFKLKCFYCKMATNYKICGKRHKCYYCKILKNYSLHNCSKTQICDIYIN